jgi:hypothetical protein
MIKLIINIAIMLFIYVSCFNLYSYLELNAFRGWDVDNALVAVIAVTLVYGAIAAAILFSVVETLFLD